MKFFNIENTQAFFQKILSCKGNVYCKDSNGDFRDLKRAAHMFSDLGWLFYPQRVDEIDVILEQDTDSRLLLHDMIDGIYSR